MQFLYAISGWHWALAAAVPIGILALYFLKLKRRPLHVPSTFLWKKSIEDLHVNALWQRLRRSILLFLQLAVAALVILALLRPTVDARHPGKRIILLIDNSASMTATDVEPTRLAAAQQKAIELLEQMQSGDAAMVIAFSDKARVVSSYSENVPALKHAVLSIAPTARRTNLTEALTIGGWHGQQSCPCREATGGMSASEVSGVCSRCVGSHRLGFLRHLSGVRVSRRGWTYGPGSGVSR